MVNYIAMKKLVIAGLIAFVLLSIIYCGPYYVIDERDLVKTVRVGDVYLYSHNWKSHNPFNEPIVHKVTVLQIKKRQRTEYVRYRFENGVIYSVSMKQFKHDIRRLNYKYKK